MDLDMKPKYSILEIERKWLINIANLPKLKLLKRKIIEDKYIFDTRIRLRKVLSLSDGEIIYKLTKKYGKSNKYTEPVTNIYLTKSEFDIFNLQKGSTIKKTRYYYPFERCIFAIDEIKLPKKIIYLLEVEVKNEIEFMNIKLPFLKLKEVTNNIKFSGKYLSVLYCK